MGHFFIYSNCMGGIFYWYILKKNHHPLLRHNKRLISRTNVNMTIYNHLEHNNIIQITKPVNSLIILFCLSAEETLNGYVHLVSKVKTSSNLKNKYFDMRLIQTSENDSVRVVCYSPEKRQNCLNKTPVKITETRANKRPSLMDE